MQKSIKSRAMSMAHIIHKSGLGFTFSRCLTQAYAALKTSLANSYISNWLIGCLSRADDACRLSLEVHSAMLLKIREVFSALQKIRD